MPYIGNTIRAADDYRLIDDISSGFNGSTTSFALQVAGSAPVPFPKSPQQVLISVNGVIQEPDPTGASGFNLVGTNIVFSSAPTNGHAFFGIIYATADYLNAGGNFPSGSLGAPSITFIGDENSGLYRKSGGSVGFVSDAVEIANFDSNGITISSGNIIIPDSIIHNGDSNTKIRFPGADTVSIETGGSEHVRVVSDGKVGIGTISPDFNCEIEGTGSGTGVSLGITNTGSAPAGVNLRSGHGNWSIYNSHSVADALEFRDESRSAVPMIINSTGNVGIGTTSPTGVLEIDAASTTDMIMLDVGGTNFAKIGHNSSGGSPLLDVRSEGHFRILTNGNNERFRISSAGKVGIGTTDPQRTLHLSSDNTVFALTDTNASTDEKTKYILSDAGVLAFGKLSDDYNTATEHLRLANDGVFTAQKSGSFGNTSDSFTALSITSSTSGISELRFADTTANAGFIKYEHSDNNLIFANNTNEKMRIDSSGRLGIGTTSPSSKIDIHCGTDNTGLQITSTDAGAFASYFDNTGASTIGHSGTDLVLSCDPAGSVGSSNIVFQVDSNTERMRIDSSGGVLIGTQTSSENLRLAEKFAIVGVNVAYPGMNITEYNNTSASHGPIIDFQRSRSTTDGGHTIVQNGDKLGEIIFRGADGNGFSDSSAIRAFVDGNPGDQDMPGRITFSTCADGSVTLTERMRITSQGQVTKISQPAFYANAGTTRNGYSNAVIQFLNTHYNIGSAYDTSNGRFTAPVAGIYIFGGAPGYVETGQTYSVTILKNGGTITEVQRVIQGDFPSHSMFGFSTALSLAANDYVELFQNNSMHQNGTYSHWFGYLLG